MGLWAFWQAERAQWRDPCRLREWQGRRLRKLVRHAYASVPFYRRLYDQAGVDPAAIRSLDEQTFHHELADILTRLRDAHTRYSGPAALEDVSAVLPFFVEMIGSTQAPTYVVSRVTEDLGPTFREGVVVRYWNGVPIDLAVLRWSEHEVGGRPDSQRVTADAISGLSRTAAASPRRSSRQLSIC